ncbi:histidinol phosphate phosphatase [Neisseria maigaei]|uniref:histidinol phosphate phosphatase n=1 Tax=Neisseria maigaei TaxID=2830651 RepID=UPI0026585072|nr:histidinol phosphate phosphatase [Neisseria maigaei]
MPSERFRRHRGSKRRQPETDKPPFPGTRLCREEQGNQPENLAAHPDAATKETPGLHGVQAAAQAPSTTTEEAFCCCLNTFKNT